MTKKELSAMKKKTGAELQDFLAFKRRGSVVPAKKGKGCRDDPPEQRAPTHSAYRSPGIPVLR